MALSVALRISHYDVCLDAKVAQLEDVFQAKVGWLAGNIYSRVGTPDLEEREEDPDRIKADFYETVLRGHTAWLSSTQVQEFKRLLKAERQGDPAEKGSVRELIAQIPADIDILARRAANQLATNRLLSEEPDAEARAARLLANDRVLKRIIRGD